MQPVRRQRRHHRRERHQRPRLVDGEAQIQRLYALDQVIEVVLSATWKAPRVAGLQGATQDVVDHVVLEELLALAASSSPEASAVVRAQVLSLKAWLAGNAGADRTAAVARIDIFEKNPEKFAPASAPAAPPGPPIGDEE